MTKKVYELKNFNLFYEDLEPKNMKTAKTTKREQTKLDVKPVKKSVPKPSFKPTTPFVVMGRKVYPTSVSAKESTKKQQQIRENQRKSAILGIGLLLVIASIIYSTYVIYIGVDSSASRLALLPQVAFAVFTSIKAFSKLYK